jgi:hypothetical protein
MVDTSVSQETPRVLRRLPSLLRIRYLLWLAFSWLFIRPYEWLVRAITRLWSSLKSLEGASEENSGEVPVVEKRGMGNTEREIV